MFTHQLLSAWNSIVHKFGGHPVESSKIIFFVRYSGFKHRWPRLACGYNKIVMAKTGTTQLHPSFWLPSKHTSLVMNLIDYWSDPWEKIADNLIIKDDRTKNPKNKTEPHREDIFLRRYVVLHRILWISTQLFRNRIWRSEKK